MTRLHHSKAANARRYLDCLSTGDDTPLLPNVSGDFTRSVSDEFAQSQIFAGRDIPRFRPGDRIADYIIERLLGCGGMSYVYQAVDKASHERIAIKVPRRASPWANDQLCREFRLTKSVAADGITQMHRLHQHEDFRFITQSLINGCSVTQWVRGNTAVGCLPPLDRLYSATTSLARTLVGLHRQNVIHRDIKPNNTLVDEHGRVTMIDFGLSGRIRTIGHWSNADLHFGTFRYLAPEVVLSSLQTTASDMFSFGRLLFMLLSGRLPSFDLPLNAGWSDQQIASQIACQLPCGTPSDLIQLCIEMHSFDPSVRPSAVEVLNVLSGTFSNDNQFSLPRQDRSQRIVDVLKHISKGANRRNGCLVFFSTGIDRGILSQAVELMSGDDNLLTIQSRVFRDEHIPFNAINPLVSELAQWMRNIDPIVRRKWSLRSDSPAIKRWPMLGILSTSNHRIAHAVSPDGAGESGLSDLTQLIERLATERTVILCVNDLQHADAESWAAIRALQDVASRSRLLIFASIDPKNRASTEEFLSSDSEHPVQWVDH